jgi:hypothetical protein
MGPVVFAILAQARIYTQILPSESCTWELDANITRAAEMKQLKHTDVAERNAQLERAAPSHSLSPRVTDTSSDAE